MTGNREVGFVQMGKGLGTGETVEGFRELWVHTQSPRWVFSRYIHVLQTYTS